MGTLADNCSCRDMRSDQADEAQDSIGFGSVPNEILLKVFGYLKVTDLVQAGAVCRAWRTFSSSPTLWKPLCSMHWRTWADKFSEAIKVLQGSDIDWKSVFCERLQMDVRARALLADLAWPLKFETSVQELEDLGLLITDELMRLSEMPGDLLESQRYFAKVALERVWNANTVKEMEALMQTPENQMEDKLLKGALLIAKLRYPCLDTAEIEQKLERIAEAVTEQLQVDPEVARFGGLSTPRGQLAALMVLNKNLFGVPEGDNMGEAPLLPLGLRGNPGDYYNPKNSFINDVLETGLGIPISLAVIHAHVGRLCGIPVEMVAVPTHFLTKVGADCSPEETFVDAFACGKLLTRQEVAGLISSLMFRSQVRLDATPANRVWVRMCNNLKGIHEQQVNADGPSEHKRYLRKVASLLLAIDPPAYQERFRRAQLALGCEEFEAAMKDLRVLIDSACEAQEIPRALLEQWLREVDRLKAEHERMWQQQRTPRPPQVLYRVGCIMRHLRYGYRGVIYGWDPECLKDEEWMAAMNVDGLPGGRYQPFYQVIVDEEFRRGPTYVAQENVEILEDGPPLSNPELGLHFLGYQSGRYVPNAYLQFRYPDDSIPQDDSPMTA